MTYSPDDLRAIEASPSLLLLHRWLTVPTPLPNGGAFTATPAAAASQIEQASATKPAQPQTSGALLALCAASSAGPEATSSPAAQFDGQPSPTPNDNTAEIPSPTPGMNLAPAAEHASDSAATACAHVSLGGPSLTLDNNTVVLAGTTAPTVAALSCSPVPSELSTGHGANNFLPPNAASNGASQTASQLAASTPSSSPPSLPAAGTVSSVTPPLPAQADNVPPYASDSNGSAGLPNYYCYLLRNIRSCDRSVWQSRLPEGSEVRFFQFLQLLEIRTPHEQSSELFVGGTKYELHRSPDAPLVDVCVLALGRNQGYPDRSSAVRLLGLD